MRRLKSIGFLFHRLASKNTPSIGPCPCQSPKFLTPFWRPGKTQISDSFVKRVYSSTSSASACATALADLRCDYDYGYRDIGLNWYEGEGMEVLEEECGKKIPVKAFFLSTSIDLKGMQSELVLNAVPPTSRTSNYIVLKFFEIYSRINESGEYENVDCTQYMVVFQYGSAVLFNVEDHEVDLFLNIIRRHASGLVQEMRKDDYSVKEKPELAEDMQGGPDYVVLKNLDADAICIIGSVLGQSIALDHFVSQVDAMVEEFDKINRWMETSGTFTMRRKKLFQLVGKANSNLADIILKVGLFDRSEIAWREAKYAQINEYMREEYEMNQRFGNLDFKLKFVEHNIHFLQKALQNRKSNILQLCIISVLGIQNVVSVYEIVLDSTEAAATAAAAAAGSI